MPKAHQRHLEWTPTRIITWARTIGVQTAALVGRPLSIRAASRSCARSWPETATTSTFTGVIESALADTALRLHALREAIGRSDASAIRQLAHALSGSLLNLGISRMAAVATALEAGASRGSVDGTAAMLKQLEDEFERVRMALAAELQAAKP